MAGRGGGYAANSYRTDALVLRTYKLGEADRIIVLLTPGHGQIRAVAKGVRRTTSKFGATLEPFMLSRLQLVHGRNLDIITQAQSVTPYGSAIAADYDAYAAASAMVETAERLTVTEVGEHGGGVEAPSQYRLLHGALAALARQAHAPRLLLDSYLLRALATAGWAPSFTDCARCGAPGPHRSVNVTLGGVSNFAFTVGSALPHLVNALGGARWELVVTVTSAATFAGALVAAVLVREGPFPFPQVRLRFADAGAVLRNPVVVRATLGYFGHMWELYAMWAWFATFALGSAAIGGSLRNAALLAFAVIAVGLLGCIVGGVAGDRIGRARTASIALLVSGGCCVLAGFVHQAPGWMFIALGLLWGVSVIADSAQFSALVTERGDPRYVGTALTLQLGLGFLLTAATIWILPLLAAHLGSWQWVFLVLLPGPLLGLLALWPLARAEAVATRARHDHG